MVGGSDENEEKGKWNLLRGVEDEIPAKRRGIDLGRDPERYPFPSASLSIDTDCFPSRVRLAKYPRGFRKVG